MTADRLDRYPTTTPAVCGCPGAGAVFGTAYAVHVTPLICSPCGRFHRGLWWDGKRHLCAPCFREVADRLIDPY